MPNPQMTNVTGAAQRGGRQVELSDWLLLGIQRSPQFLDLWQVTHRSGLASGRLADGCGDDVSGAEDALGDGGGRVGDGRRDLVERLALERCRVVARAFGGEL